MKLGRTIRFDASGSTDTETPNDLDYSWNMGDGGVEKDAVGETVNHTYAKSGVYQATVTVTDPKGGTDTDTVQVKVSRHVQCGAESVSRTGGWAARHNGGAQLSHYCDNAPKGTTGDTIGLRFTGPSLKVNYGKAQSGGVAKVFVDGRRVRDIVFTGRSKTPRFGWTTTYNQLGSGTHSIRLVVKKPDGIRKLASSTASRSPVAHDRRRARIGTGLSFEVGADRPVLLPLRSHWVEAPARVV